MRRVAKPLEAMGARIELPPHGGLPMNVHGGTLADIAWRSEVASAQVKSAILLAGVVGGVHVTLDEPAPTRDHTERMLGARGVNIATHGTRVELAPTDGCIAALDTEVPGDPSSAAFFAALAALADGGQLTLHDVCVNETRTGFLETLQRTLSPSETQRTWFRQNPPLPYVKWSLRNNNNYEQTGILVSLNYQGTEYIAAPPGISSRATGWMRFPPWRRVMIRANFAR